MTDQGAGTRGEVIERVLGWYEGHKADSVALRDELIRVIDAAVAEAVEEAVRVERARLTPLWEARMAAAREQAQGEERERCIAIARQWADSKSCTQHDDNPCCHVRTGEGIASALSRPPGGAPPICAGGIEPTDTWRPPRPGGAPDEGAQ